MKILLKVLGGLLACLILLLLVLSVTGFEPHGLYPGLWLKGELVTTPVTDWSFTDQFRIIEIQTRTWYLIPHSVHVSCVAHEGQLYLDSVYGEGGNYPPGRRWNDNVARDPHVRLKIDGKLYDRALVRITDEAQIAAVEATKLKKYKRSQAPAGSRVGVLYHVVDN